MPAGRRYLDAGAERILLDTAGGPHPGGTGTRWPSAALAAAVARGPPRHPGRRPRRGQRRRSASCGIPAIGVDVASGVEAARASPAERPAEGPVRGGALRQACPSGPLRPAHRGRPPDARPRACSRPTPHGRWGIDRDFGGRYVPETLMAALEALERGLLELRRDPRFWAELRELLATYSAGRRRSTAPIGWLPRAREAGRLAPRGRPRAALRLYLKREDLDHTGAHKINNALGQVLLTRRLGKPRVIAETGAGQHGVATATACALLGLPCVVYMGAEDIERQQPNVLRMRALGAEVRPVTSGTRDAQGRRQRGDARLGDERRDDPLRPRARRWARTRTRRSCATSSASSATRPRRRCTRRGPAAGPRRGLRRRRLERDRPARRGSSASRQSAWRGRGGGRGDRDRSPRRRPGRRHPGRPARLALAMLQDEDGQVIEAHSISAGLDYPGIGPQIAALVAAGRLELSAPPMPRPWPRPPCRPHRGHPAGPRDRPCHRCPAPPARRRRRVGPAGPDDTSSSWVSPGAATRTSRPSSARGSAPDDRRG